MKRLHLLTAVAVLSVACGGGQKTQTSDGEGAGASTYGTEGGAAAAGRDAGPEGGDAGVAVDAGPPPAVTFVIKNTGTDDLVFSTDKGWQPIIFGFSGKPPKAKPIIMFPKFCTAACSAPAEERCPYCPEPEKVKEIKAAEKREIVPPGGQLEVPWDGQVYSYQRTRGTRDGRAKRCDCYETAEVPAETYTVRVCGLRVTKSADEHSKLQCEDGSMTVPSEEPLRVDLEFPDPGKKAKKAR